MVQQSYKVLPFKHISEATKEAVSYIKARRNHEIELLKSRWKKFNQISSIEPNCIYTIGGISGTGKSSFLNTLETDLIELNPSEEIIVLSFSFEMLSARQIGRKFSNKLRQTTSQLYSINSDIADDLLQKIEVEADILKNYPIYYVDDASSVTNIENTIKYFQETIAKDKWLIVTLDHALLVDGDDTNDERKIIEALEKAFIRRKKVGKTSIIQLSQMNRNIEMPERIMNPSGHYPMRSDIASSDAVFRSSDVVLILSRPEILGITAYGPQRLPVINKVYIHFLKVREGELAILEFENDLKYNNLIETNKDETNGV